MAKRGNGAMTSEALDLYSYAEDNEQNIQNCKQRRPNDQTPFSFRSIRSISPILHCEDTQIPGGVLLAEGCRSDKLDKGWPLLSVR